MALLSSSSFLMCRRHRRRDVRPYLCRGNQASRWLVSGDYGPIAKAIFQRTAAHRLPPVGADEGAGFRRHNRPSGVTPGLCGPEAHSAKRFVTGSRPREVARQLLLEFGEVARDHCCVEASEDQLFRLAVEQKPEGRLETALWRCCRRSTARRSLGTSSPRGGSRPALRGRPPRTRGVALACTLDLDHVDVLQGWVRLPRIAGREFRGSQRRSQPLVRRAVNSTR